MGCGTPPPFVQGRDRRRSTNVSGQLSKYLHRFTAQKCSGLKFVTALPLPWPNVACQRSWWRSRDGRSWCSERFRYSRSRLVRALKHLEGVDYFDIGPYPDRYVGSSSLCRTTPVADGLLQFDHAGVTVDRRSHFIHISNKGPTALLARFSKKQATRCYLQKVATHLHRLDAVVTSHSR